MTFFRFKTKLYPLIAITASLFVIIFGLVAARNENLCWYLLGVLAWLCIFGCFKGVLKILPAFRVCGHCLRFGGRRFSGGALHAQPLRRTFFGGCAQYVDCRRQNDKEPLASTYAACNHFGYAHLYVLCADAQRGDRSRARGDEDTRRRQRSQSKDIIQGFPRAVRHEARQRSLYSIYKKEYPALSDVLFILGIVAGAVLVVVL